MGSRGGESSALLISGHLSTSDRPDALIYGLRAKEGSSEMIRGVRESSEARNVDSRIACKM